MRAAERLDQLITGGTGDLAPLNGQTGRLSGQLTELYYREIAYVRIVRVPGLLPVQFEHVDEIVMRIRNHVPRYQLPDPFRSFGGGLYGGLYGPHVAQDSNGHQASVYLFNGREFNGRSLNGCVGRFDDTGESTCFDES